MISSLQVYDASNNPIPCQVNPVVTSDGIAQSKYEVSILYPYDLVTMVACV